MMTVFLAGTAACAQTQSTTDTVSIENTESSESSENSESSEDVMIRLDDILSATDLIGKNYEECGLKTPPGIESIKIAGDFFGIPVTGAAWFWPSDEENISCMDSVSFSVKNSSIGDFYGQLNGLYSGPSDAGEEPYVESNGGARQWYTFDAGEALINISQGSRESFVSITISKNPSPGYTGELTLVKHQKRVPSGEMGMNTVRYEDGILTVLITNRLGESSVYTDDYVLARKKDGETGYSSMVHISLQVSDEEPETYEIEDKKTGELACDLRIFGKVEPGSYMLILDDMQTTFELVGKE